jgi:GNAT superfamily N-acetyltransferase
VFAHVVEKGGQIVAIALWFLNYSTWTGRNGIYLEDLFVREGERRHGYGRALLKALAEVCAERGYRRLEWSVLDWNEPSILTGVGHAQKQRLRFAAQVPVGPRPLNAHSPCARARRVGRSLGNRPPGAAIYSSA